MAAKKKEISGVPAIGKINARIPCGTRLSDVTEFFQDLYESLGHLTMGSVDVLRVVKWDIGSEGELNVVITSQGQT